MSIDRALSAHAVVRGCCGVLFLVGEGIRVDIEDYCWETPFRSNDFFMFYFMLTGIHVFHVALGLVFLGGELRDCASRKRRVHRRDRGDLLAYGRPALGRHLRARLRAEVKM